MHRKSHRKFLSGIPTLRRLPALALEMMQQLGNNWIIITGWLKNMKVSWDD
jgi:hypothetical protein